LLRKKERCAIKNVELKLVAELIRNSRRNDGDLAKAIGVSQPTIRDMSLRSTERENEKEAKVQRKFI